MKARRLLFGTLIVLMSSFMYACNDNMDEITIDRQIEAEGTTVLPESDSDDDKPGS